MNDTYSLETPEAVHLDYEVAGLGSRFLAALIDSVLLVVAVTLLALAALFAIGLVTAGGALTELARSDTESFLLWGVAALVLGLFAVFWGYFVFFEMVWNGQSPGKRICGLRVVGQDGYPVSFAGSLVRNLVRIIDFLPLDYGLGMLVMFIDARSRRVGDFAAGTLVVKERAPLSADDLLTDFDETLESGVIIPNTERLSEQEWALIDGLLARFPRLTPARREALTQSVADQIAARLGHDRGPTSPVRFLRLVRHSYRPPAAQVELGNPGRLTPADYSMIREYFLRRDSLSPDKASLLAGQVARAVAMRLAVAAPAAPDAEAFLQQVGESYRSAHRLTR